MGRTFQEYLPNRLTNAREALYSNREQPWPDKEVAPMNLKWTLAFAGAARGGSVTLR